MSEANEGRLRRLVGDGYRLLHEGEPRQDGDEFILFDTDGTSKYWKWDGRIDAAVQGPIGPCKHTRRKIANADVTGLAPAQENEKYGVIANAITAAIGEGWTLVSLAGRLVRKMYPDKVEVVALDGKDILELHPIRFEQVTEGGSIKIKAVQDYRLLRPNASSSGGTPSFGCCAGSAMEN